MVDLPQNPLPDRAETWDKFTGTLKPGVSQLCSLTGPAGSEKTMLLEAFKDYATAKGYACLTLNWTQTAQDLIQTASTQKPDATSFWLYARLADDAYPSSKSTLQPKRFTGLAYGLVHKPKHERLKAYGELWKGLTEGVDPDKHIKKLTGSPIKPSWWWRKLWIVYYFIAELKWKNVVANPEQALLNALTRTDKKKPLVLLLDDVDRAGAFPIYSRLEGVNAQGQATWSMNPRPISLQTYLYRVWRFFEARQQPLICVLTGRCKIIPQEQEQRLHPHHTWHLSPLNQGQVQDRLEKKLSQVEYDQEAFHEVSVALTKLTFGNPFLINEALQLLIPDSPQASFDLKQAYARLLRQYHEEELHGEDQSAATRYGIFLFLEARIQKRLPQTEKWPKDLWKLVVPYQLYNHEELAKILFPQAEDNPFDVLITAGILRGTQRQLFLHEITRHSLQLQAQTHPKQTRELHTALAAFYQEREQTTAAIYHRSCNAWREALKPHAWQAEQLWWQAARSMVLELQEQQALFAGELPQGQQLGALLDKLTQEQDLFKQQDCSGDATAYLSYKIREGQLDPEDLKAGLSEARLREWLESQPHLSDLQWLLAQQLSDPTEQYAIYCKITNHINNQHARAWYERGTFEHQMFDAKQTETSFKNALQYGLSEHRNIRASAELAWLQGDQNTAAEYFQMLPPSDETSHWRYLQLLTVQQKWQEAWQLLQNQEGLTGHQLGLKLEAAYQLDLKEALTQLLEKVGKTDQTAQAWALRITERQQAKAEAVDEAEAQVVEQESVIPKAGLIPWFKFVLANASKQESSSAEPKSQPPLDQEPTDAKSWVHLGAGQYEAGDFAAAEASFEKAIAIDPQDSHPWCGLGNAQFDLVKHHDAIHSYQQAIAIDPQYTIAWNNLGNAQYELGQHHDAIQSFQQAIAIDPQFAHSWRGLGSVQSKLGNQHDAIQSYQHAIAIDPQDIYSWHSLGIAQSILGNYHDAIQSYQHAIAIDPKFIGPWNSLGIVYKQKDDHEKAEYHYQHALKLKPNFRQAWHNRAALFQKSDPTLTAHFLNIEAAIKLCEAERGTPQEWYLYAKEVWANYGRWPQAESAVNKLLERDPEHLDGLALAAEIAIEQNNIPAAQQYLDRLDALAPDHIAGLIARTKLLIAQQDFATASQTLRTWYAAQRFDDTERLMTICSLFEQAKDPEMAIKCCDYAWTISGGDLTYSYHKARILWQQQQQPLAALAELKASLNKAKPRPEALLLDAEIAHACGSFVRCQARLEALAEQAEDLTDEEQTRYQTLKDQSILMG